jgi:hypothetical protein
MTFENSQQLSHHLPVVEQVEFEQLSPSYKKVMVINRLIFTLLFILVFAGICVFQSKLLGNWWIWLTACIVFVYNGLSIAIISVRYRNMGYAVRSHDILFKSGWIWRKTVAVPFNRVQHCETYEGLFSRWYGLTNLKIYTAGGSDLQIPGLAQDEAFKVKMFVVDRAGHEEL